MTKMEAFLQGLILRTEQAKLRWSETTGDARFITSVITDDIDVFTLVIAELDDGQYQFEILNDEARTVVSLDYSSTSSDEDKLLKSLYTLAHNSAFNIDSTLETIAEALDLEL